MPPPVTTTGVERLLHCGPERTVFATTDAATGTKLVGKLLVRGSLQDAEHELAMGSLCRHLDVVDYRGAGTDPITSRPVIYSGAIDGIDLRRLVARDGALPAATAAALLQPVAATLAAMHALRLPAAPAGVAHGDLKPANLMRRQQDGGSPTTVLLDFEHARPIGTLDAAGTVGSPGFAAPELALGGPRSAASDVYACGASLRWLLAGGEATLWPQHPDVEQLLAACLASDPASRPSAALLAEALADLERRLAADPIETAVDLVARGEAATAAALAALSPDARTSHARRRWQRLQRLRHRLPAAFLDPAAEPTEPSTVQRELTSVLRLLRHAPRHPGFLAWRQRLLAIASRLLAQAPQQLQLLRQQEDHAGGLWWLSAAMAMVATASHTPGGLPTPELQAADPRRPGLLQREPVAFLLQQQQEMAAAAAELAAAAEQITAAELALDLPAAERAVQEMAANYGGAAPTVARRRDQLHRLSFYLQRASRALPNLARLQQLVAGLDVQAVETMLTATAAADETRAGGAPVGLRSLQNTLHNLLEEFPHLQARLGPVMSSLAAALVQATERAVEMLQAAQQQLRTEPVPVRPLQLVLGKLDGLRQLEAFVDLPQRPRSQLLDHIESLRLALEQARATRDRLAQGAEQALSRGHWTTGLFDMERAIAGLGSGDAAETDEATQWRERLAEARRRKQEVEATLRRNIELAARYADLVDAASTSPNERLQLLQERRDCLLFLAVHLPGERAERYRRDLREVETQIALERAGAAEQQFDACEDPLARLDLARQTLAALGTGFADDGSGELPGRILRQREHWRTLTSQCERELERIATARAARDRYRRRLATAAMLLLLVSVVALGLAARAYFAPATLAAQR